MANGALPADRWLGKLTQLRAGNGEAGDSVSGPAPHKPLLLLSIIDLAESGKILGRVLTRTPELVLRFRALGTLVAERWPTRLQLRLPFYHLRTQGFWQAFTEEMQPAQSPPHGSAEKRGKLFCGKGSIIYWPI